jgi:hypothetical protein
MSGMNCPNLAVLCSTLTSAAFYAMQAGRLAGRLECVLLLLEIDSLAMRIACAIAPHNKDNRLRF